MGAGFGVASQRGNQAKRRERRRGRGDGSEMTKEDESWMSEEGKTRDISQVIDIWVVCLHVIQPLASCLLAFPLGWLYLV